MFESVCVCRNRLKACYRENEERVVGISISSINSVEREGGVMMQLERDAAQLPAVSNSSTAQRCPLVTGRPTTNTLESC